MFFIISQFRSISKASSGQNRIPRAIFMLGDGSKSIWYEFLTKSIFSCETALICRYCVKLFSCAFHLLDMPFASNYSIFIVVLISEIDNVFEWSNFENSSNNHPNLNNFVPKPSCGDESRLVEKPAYLTPYYSSSLHILRIYALRVTPESLPASRSIRFAASAAKFWIWRCLSWPEKQFYQINRVFHNFSI